MRIVDDGSWRDETGIYLPRLDATVEVSEEFRSSKHTGLVIVDNEHAVIEGGTISGYLIPSEEFYEIRNIY